MSLGWDELNEDRGPEWSHTAIDGRRLTWQELYEVEHEQYLRASRCETMFADLDRCEHGRHEGDICTFPDGGCGGPSHGNPLLRSDRVIGYTLGGHPIEVPDKRRQPSQSPSEKGPKP